MARKKKQEEGSGGAPAWMATFSDLMNLLLCFFVLLFSMSSISEEKYAQLVASLSNTSIDIFEGGSFDVEEGKLISSGASQLNELGEYYDNMGEPQESQKEEDIKSDFQKELHEKNKELTTEMYGEVVDKAEKYKVDNYVEVDFDRSDFQYVQISLNGSILFDSGKAEIKKEAIPVFSKVGDILKMYDKCQIEIEGHTDNVPISSSKYPNNNWLSSARALNVAEYLINEKKLDAKTLKYSGRGEYDPVVSNKTPEGRARNRRVEIKIYNQLNSK